MENWSTKELNKVLNLKKNNEIKGLTSNQVNQVAKKKQIKDSIGKSLYHQGNKIFYPENEVYKLDQSREYYVFDIIPMGKPRMTHKDKFEKREEVEKYWAWKKELTFQANQLNFQLGNILEAIFFIPMPDSYPAKLKKSLVGLPCMEKPDCDNIIKGILDSFLIQDKNVWKTICEKRWAYYGSIIIFK